MNSHLQICMMYGQDLKPWEFIFVLSTGIPDQSPQPLCNMGVGLWQNSYSSYYFACFWKKLQTNKQKCQEKTVYLFGCCSEDNIYIFFLYLENVITVLSRQKPASNIVLWSFKEVLDIFKFLEIL